MDDEDVNIVSAAVRELWEETGLRARLVKAPVRLVPADQAGDVPLDVLETKLEMIGDFMIFRVKEVVWGKLAVWIDVESYDAVKICDEEHVEFAWVTEKEVRERKFSDGRELDFTSEGVRRNVLEGFRMWREERDSK